MRTAGAAFIILICGAALAHDSWISRESLIDPVTKEWCCNEQDCQEESDNVEPFNGGFLIKSTGEIIPNQRVIWRSRGGWWRCRYLASHQIPKGKKVGDTRCLIGPIPST